MPKVTIDVWQFIEVDVFMRYKFAGTCDGKPFCCTIGIEIDGRDAEYDHHWGENMDVTVNQDNWDALIMAFNENEELTKHMAAESEAYWADN